MPLISVDSVSAAMEQIGATDAPVVVVPVYNGFEDVAALLRVSIRTYAEAECDPRRRRLRSRPSTY